MERSVILMKCFKKNPNHKTPNKQMSSIFKMTQVCNPTCARIWVSEPFRHTQNKFLIDLIFSITDVVIKESNGIDVLGFAT